MLSEIILFFFLLNSTARIYYNYNRKANISQQTNKIQRTQ